MTKKTKFYQFGLKLYKLTSLRQFYSKNTFEKIFSIFYNLLFMLVSFMGLVPIIDSMIPYGSFDYSSYFFYVFIFSFLYLLDWVIRIFTIRQHYGFDSNWLNIRHFILSAFATLELGTWITTITLVFQTGNLDGAHVVMTTKFAQIFCVVTSILFLLNVFNGYKKFLLYSHNMSDFDLFKHLIKSKIKFWIISTLIIFFIILLISYGIYVFEIGYEHPTTASIDSMWDALYFSLVTVSTIGFGDVMPINPDSRPFIVILIICGIYMYAFLSSQLINVFNDFFKKKKEISQHNASEKQKEIEQEYMLQKIDEMIVRNLYELGFISKSKYQKALNRKEKVNKKTKSNEFNDADFFFDEERREIFHCGSRIGNIVNDEKQIKEASNKKWLAITSHDKGIVKPEAALFFLTTKIANELNSIEKNIRIIFTSKQIDKLFKKLIIFQRKPFISSICEFDIVGVSYGDKDQIWNKFGHYSNLSKDKYRVIFKKSKNVSAILINNIIYYEKPKLIETYGLSATADLKDIIPLV